MPFDISRKELYRLVWSKPLRALAKEIGISDVAIGKHCRSVDVPLPGAGYWNKVAAGKEVKRIDLPIADLATRKKITLSGSAPDGFAAEQSEDDETFDFLYERFKKRIHGKIPRASLKPAHNGVRRRLEKDEKAKAERAKFGYAWLTPVYDDPVQRRKLTLMNGLHLAATAAGGDCLIRAAEDDLMYLSIGHLHAQCRVEVSNKGRRGEEETAPSLLKLWVDTYNLPFHNVPTSWTDKPGAPLEGRMEEVLLGVVVVAARLREILEERQRDENKRRQEELAQFTKDRLAAIARSEDQKELDEEKARVNLLIEEAKNWRLAADIRSYVAAAIAQKHAAVGDVWSEWALDQARKIDPLETRSPPIEPA